MNQYSTCLRPMFILELPVVPAGNCIDAVRGRVSSSGLATASSAAKQEIGDDVILALSPVENRGLMPTDARRC